MTFGEKLQALRKSAGMSQDTLAEALEVSRQAISKWERDEAMPETEKIVRIAKLFSVTTDRLLMEDVPAGPTASSPSAARPHSGAAARLERLIRRHGYKAGFAMIAVGVVICLISLIFRGFWVDTVTNMTSSFGSFVDSSFSIVTPDGDHWSDIPGLYNPPAGFQQGSSNIASTAASFGNLYLIGLIPGLGLIGLGIYIVIKGKKLAEQTK